MKFTVATLLLAAFLILGGSGPAEARKRRLRRQVADLERKVAALEHNFAILRADFSALRQYVIHMLTSTTTTTTPGTAAAYPAGPSWLGMSCSANPNVCNIGGDTVSCYKGKCYCAEGYHYAAKRGICVNESAWLNSGCNSNSDCPSGINSFCWYNRCNCNPGYYYSVSRDACVPHCALQDLADSFTFYYRGNIIVSYHIIIRGQTEEQECFRLCESYGDCTSFDYRPHDRMCFPSNDTAMTKSWGPVNHDNHDHYQRFCR